MELNRRSFLKGSAIVGSAAMFGLVGCATASPSEKESPSSVKTTADAATSENYLVAPEPIADDQIKETIEADIVVVGAGNAGAVATATAAEEGASVILLQKEDCVFSNGSGFACCNSKLHQEMDCVVDGWKIMDDLMRNGGNNLAKWEVVRNWVDYSGAVADWIVDLFVDTNLGPFILENPSEPDNEWHRTYSAIILPRGEKINGSRMNAIAQGLVDYACETGSVDVRLSTPAVQLRQDATGRVTGVIARNAEGDYLLCNASKAVILAAGGYDGDEKMRLDLLPVAGQLGCGNPRPNSVTGDGILMGVWAGGHIQKEPHCSNIHYDPGNGVPTMKGTPVPWLRVNTLGERFSNEDVNYDMVWAQDVRQPGQMHYQIFDDNYLEDIKDMGTTGMTQNSGWDELVPKGVEEGNIPTADTLEELASLIGVPKDAFLATVDRYNKLAEGDFEYEPDFGKLASKVKKIQKPPFHAIARKAWCLSSLSGLEINGDMQVLDDDGKPIEGLYAAGNCSGNFFGGLYQRMATPGMSVGRAVLTARVSAWRACGKTREQA